MNTVDCAGRVSVDARANRSRHVAPRITALRSIGILLGAASLAACSQTAGNQRSALVTHAPSVQTRTASVTIHHRVASVRKHTPIASRRDRGDTKVASLGRASFYTEGTETASGEKFNTHDLTAAHPTLPFGTRLRVTDVDSGRSVTVRVNDRGPYVQGRIVDVSYSAAESLGMVGKGVAKVKLEVVQ